METKEQKYKKWLEEKHKIFLQRVSSTSNIKATYVRRQEMSKCIGVLQILEQELKELEKREMGIKTKFLEYIADRLQMPRVNIPINIRDDINGNIVIETMGVEVFFKKEELLSYLVLLSPIVEQQDKIDETIKKEQQKQKTKIVDNVKMIYGDKFMKWDGKKLVKMENK